jgi:hypothetical protein
MTDAAAHGLHELMIVNPTASDGAAGLVIGADGDLYRVREDSSCCSRWFLGDDGSLYQGGLTRSAGIGPRYFLGSDGALYLADRTADAPVNPGYGGGVRACHCGAQRALTPATPAAIR